MPHRSHSLMRASASASDAALIPAASLALADAGIPMRGLVSACAVGKVDGELVVDLMKEEDNYGDADVPVAMTADGQITLLQMDGHLTIDEFHKAIRLAKTGCDQMYELQRKALVEKYGKESMVETEDDSGAPEGDGDE